MEILETQAKLDLAQKALYSLSQEISQLSIGDPDYEAGILLLVNSQNALALAYTDLAIRKARNGVVGIFLV